MSKSSFKYKWGIFNNNNEFHITLFVFFTLDQLKQDPTFRDYCDEYFSELIVYSSLPELLDYVGFLLHFFTNCVPEINSYIEELTESGFILTDKITPKPVILATSQDNEEDLILSVKFHKNILPV